MVLELLLFVASSVAQLIGVYLPLLYRYKALSADSGSVNSNAAETKELKVLRQAVADLQAELQGRSAFMTKEAGVFGEQGLAAKLQVSQAVEKSQSKELSKLRQEMAGIEVGHPS